MKSQGGKRKEKRKQDFELLSSSGKQGMAEEGTTISTLLSGVFAGSCTCGCHVPICIRTYFKTAGPPLELLWSVSHGDSYVFLTHLRGKGKREGVDLIEESAEMQQEARSRNLNSQKMDMGSPK